MRKPFPLFTILSYPHMISCCMGLWFKLGRIQHQSTNYSLYVEKDQTKYLRGPHGNPLNLCQLTKWTKMILLKEMQQDRHKTFTNVWLQRINLDKSWPFYHGNNLALGKNLHVTSWQNALDYLARKIWYRSCNLTLLDLTFTFGSLSNGLFMWGFPYHI